MEELLSFSGAKRDKLKNIIDIGCGVGGSSRFLARSCKNADVTGVTLSPVQVRTQEIYQSPACFTDPLTILTAVQAARAQEINREEGLEQRVTNEVANALRLPYPDSSFDLAWSLESGEHMPDKEAWLAEVYRILKPGGTFVCVTWCHRETVEEQLSASEVRLLGRI